VSHPDDRIKIAAMNALAHISKPEFVLVMRWLLKNDVCMYKCIEICVYMQRLNLSWWCLENDICMYKCNLYVYVYDMFTNTQDMPVYAYACVHVNAHIYVDRF
jgi:hypothetical protein